MPLRKLAGLIAGWLYPRAACCLCCGDPRRAGIEDCLCPACRMKLKEWKIPPEACGRCLSPVKPGRPCAFCRGPLMGPIQRVYAPYRFGGEVRQLIHQMKFNACEEAVPLLAQAMADALPDRDFDCVSPVPLHPRRQRQRGYNQALLLCRALSLRTGIPVLEPLRRNSYHRPQSLMPADQRRKNVEGAFSCHLDVSGLRVLLVDDVRTTGSTAFVCAGTLMENGADSVSCCFSAVVYKKKKQQ